MHLLRYFPDIRSLVEPVARIEEIQRVQFVYYSDERSHTHSVLTLHRECYRNL